MKNTEELEEFQPAEDLKVFDTSDLHVILESELGGFSEEELEAMTWVK
jgi:hypothetical protein